MHRMGTVLKYDSKGNLVAELDKAAELPKLGTIAVDKSGKRIGRIFDIIGNVRKPYLVIKTTHKDKIDAVYMGENKKMSRMEEKK